MLGAYFAVTFTSLTGSLILGILIATVASALIGVIVDRLLISKLYYRDPLDQLLATFGLVLFFDEATPIIWGPAGLTLQLPQHLSGSVNLLHNLEYPVWRLFIILTGLLIALGLFFLIKHTRIGMKIRSGASDPEMTETLGINLPLLFTGVFALGSALAGLAGILTAPLLSVQPGMGNDILVLAFVVIVIGGLGSIKGAFIASILLGIVDTSGRLFLPEILNILFSFEAAETMSPAFSSMFIYFVMILILYFKPHGFFPSVQK